MAPKTFASPTPRSTGIARVVLKRAFFDPAEAVKSCLPLPEDELLLVLGANCPEALKPAMFEIAEKLTHEERALITVCIGFGFHGGYSVRLSDEEDGNKNLHAEYIHEQQRATNGTAAIGR